MKDSFLGKKKWTYAYFSKNNCTFFDILTYITLEASVSNFCIICIFEYEFGLKLKSLMQFQPQEKQIIRLEWDFSRIFEAWWEQNKREKHNLWHRERIESEKVSSSAEEFRFWSKKARHVTLVHFQGMKNFHQNFVKLLSPKLPLLHPCVWQFHINVNKKLAWKY